MKIASHGKVIGPLLGNPNSSSDISKSWMKIEVLRYANGTTKRVPSVVYTTKWPLSGFDFLHKPRSIRPSAFGTITLPPMAANFCHFLTFFTRLLGLIMAFSSMWNLLYEQQKWDFEFSECWGCECVLSAIWSSGSYLYTCQCVEGRNTTVWV